MNIPHTVEGIAVLSAAEAAVYPGYSTPVLDVGGALALAQAKGVEPSIAAVLVQAAAAGITNGAADRSAGVADGS